MADKKVDDPVAKILQMGAPYPMVVLPPEGEYWVDGTNHVATRDNDNNLIFPSNDMSRCTIDQDENIYIYRRNFAGKEHINYVGEDLKHGSFLISVLHDVPDDDSVEDHYLVIVRTNRQTMLKVIHSSSLASSLPGPRDFLRFVHGEEPDVDRIQPIAIPRVSEEILRFDEHTSTFCHKVGVLYQKFGQVLEEDYLQNQDMSPEFIDFLELIGDKVTLKDFANYRGGLDVKYGQTGDYSYYTTFKDREIMFHVSPLLPYTPKDSQQLGRKRHIGNDVVCIVFQDSNTPFSPSSIRSHFLHVFVVIQVERTTTNDTLYKLSVTAKEGVPRFIPHLPNPCIFKKGPEFRNFLLTKILNAETAALHCEKFSLLGKRTRWALLEQLVSDLTSKSDMVLESGRYMEDDAETSQKSSSFLSTFRSAWQRTGRTSSNPSPNNSDDLKKSKNLGQSLSLNDLSILSLEIEDGEKDVNITGKEKKRKKKSSLATSTISMLKCQLAFGLNNMNDVAPVIRNSRNTHNERNSKAKSTSFADNFQVCDSGSLSRNTFISASKGRSQTVNEIQENGCDTHCDSMKDLEKDNSSGLSSESELQSSKEEIKRLQAVVDKLEVDKTELVQVKENQQNEIRKLRERLSYRKEKRKDVIFATSTEYV